MVDGKWFICSRSCAHHCVLLGYCVLQQRVQKLRILAPHQRSRSLDILHPRARINNEELMNIEIRDAALRARIEKQLQAIGASSIEEVLLHLLETQEEQDRWLAENREAIDAKIKRGIQQLDRGEGIPDDQ